VETTTQTASDPAEHTESIANSAHRLSCSSVSVAYAGVQALSAVTLWVDRGEIVGLIGPNGAGKTTLLNAVSGFAQIKAGGSVILDGTDISMLAPERRTRLGLARTFQHGHLFHDLDVRENIELGAIAVGCSAREAKRRADILLEESGLSDFPAAIASQLSHGDQQRVSVARAVIGEPSFLLLDEPAAGLPEEGLDDLRLLIEYARSAHDAGILLIDHNVEFVLGLSDRVVVLDHGEVLAEGSPEYVRNHAGVMSAYFGTARPTMTAPGEAAGVSGDGDLVETSGAGTASSSGRQELKP